jgi:outer membrane protein assembly factor BamB
MMITVIGKGFTPHQDLRCNFGTVSSSAEYVSSEKVTCKSAPSKLLNTETGRRVRFYLSGGGEISTDHSFTFVATLLVSDVHNHAVHMFNAYHASFMQTIIKSKEGGLEKPEGVAWGADGHIYVASSGNDQIIKFNAGNGQFIGIFAKLTPGCTAKGMVFGPDGNLFVACSTLNKVFAYNSQSGQLLGVAAQGGGLSRPCGIAFGRGSTLFVLSAGSRSVLSFAQGGYFQGSAFKATDARTGIAFHDGDLYVIGGSESQYPVLRVRSGTGQQHTHSHQLVQPVDLVFDNAGTMFVSSSAKIVRINSKTGQAKGGFKGPANMQAGFMSLSRRDNPPSKKHRRDEL